jgi:hypothetical protein
LVGFTFFWGSLGVFSFLFFSFLLVVVCLLLVAVLVVVVVVVSKSLNLVRSTTDTERGV